MAAYKVDNVIVCCFFTSNHRTRQEGFFFFFLQENVTVIMKVSIVIFLTPLIAILKKTFMVSVGYWGSKYFYRVQRESGQVLYTTALVELNQVSICTMISSQ